MPGMRHGPVTRLERFEPFEQRTVDEVVAVEVEAVEEADGERAARIQVEAAHRVLEQLRPFVVAESDRLAVEHDGVGGQRPAPARRGRERGRSRR